MQLKRFNIYTLKTLTDTIWNKLFLIKGLYLFLSICFVLGCDDFVDVELPKNQLASAAVFEDEATATAAIRSIYAKMRDGKLPTSLSYEMGLYTDELDQFNSQNSFYDHSILASNPPGWWSNTYNLIYAANDAIEGIENSTALSLEVINQLKGEALFIRAYLHLYLVELYGPIPYIQITDYIINTSVSRMPEDVVYSHIITDLLLASNLLGEDISGERVRVYEAVADALLARVYLYTEDWEAAEATASKIISSFVLEPNINEVFLKNSSGSIWQFKPLDGENNSDANFFIFEGQPSSVALNSSLSAAFELGDQRLSNWVGSTTNGSITYNFAFKYKEATNTSTSIEYPVIFRLAEQYLIRAEARVRDGKILGAQSDLNVIRTRAGLPNTIATTDDDLLDAILHERKVELFTEHGHRWFDLKRTGNATEVLFPIKPGWRNTDILFPIPESEILLNPNLLPQNDGYQ